MVDLSSFGVKSIWIKSHGEGRRLLGVFAHPDDESFGPGATLAKYADEGVEVHILTVTDGAAGDQLAPLPPGVASLAELRTHELKCAVERLGATALHLLGYRDSGMSGTPANLHPDSLFQADKIRVTCQICAVIRALRPHVVLTHDATGGYFHPDHIRTHELTTAAFHAAADPAAYPEAGAPWQPEFLYYMALPKSRIRKTIWLARLTFKDPRRWGRNGDIDLTRLGVPDQLINVRVDVRDKLEHRARAGSCHRSQGGDNRPNTLWARLTQRRIVGTSPWDTFIQAWPPVRPGAVVKTDLFNGQESGGVAPRNPASAQVERRKSNHERPG